jgi:hypothetical protein
MRLPLIPPTELSPEQRSLYDEMRKGIAGNFNAFKVEREDGALMGPWNPWLHCGSRRPVAGDVCRSRKSPYRPALHELSSSRRSSIAGR